MLGLLPDALARVLASAEIVQVSAPQLVNCAMSAGALKSRSRSMSSLSVTCSVSGPVKLEVPLLAARLALSMKSFTIGGRLHWTRGDGVKARDMCSVAVTLLLTEERFSKSTLA